MVKLREEVGVVAKARKGHQHMNRRSVIKMGRVRRSELKIAAFQTKPVPSQFEEQEPEMRYAVIAAGAAPHQAGGAAGLSAAQQSSPEQLPLQVGGAVGLSAAQQTEQPWGVSD